MSQVHEGACLCGNIRYVTKGEPLRVTLCYCRFCQRATGSTHLVEPVFQGAAFELISGSPNAFTLTSAGSGKEVNVHFCGACGTKLYLTFERFADVVGIYGGTFDEPGWFACHPTTACLFLDSAPPGAIFPAGVPVYHEHRMQPDGTPNEPVTFDAPFIVERTPDD
jgi:hypothetical protein